ncbi:MAG: hypothetical protein MI923_24375 [Phycisphaerales bacterium]|nr:hypothetical protein [Phycisphaerales bacterium]
MPSIDEQNQQSLSENVIPTSPLGHRIMFVVFALLAFGLFAPTILLPILREHCELLAEEGRLTKQCTELEQETIRQDALLEAFATDQTINERLAVLDLHYKNPNEIVVPVLRTDQVTVTPSFNLPEFQSDLSIPAHWPRSVRRLERWAEKKGLIDLYLDPALRPAFLLMAGGLIIAAFVLCAPRTHRLRSGRDSAGVGKTAMTPLG